MKGYSVSSSPSRISGVIFFWENEVSWPTTKKQRATAGLSAIGASHRDEPAADIVGRNPGIEPAIKGRPGAMVLHTTVETDPVVRLASVVRAAQRAAPEGRVRRAGTAIVASAPTMVSVRSADRAISVGVGSVRRRQAVTVGIIVRPEDGTISAAEQTVHRREAPTAGSALSADGTISAAVTSAPPEATAIVMNVLHVVARNFSADRVSAPMTGVRIRRAISPRRCGGVKRMVRTSTGVPAGAG